MSQSRTFSGRLGRFASYNVAQQVWLAMISLVATPILYHGLGEEAFGILAIVNLLAAQLAVLEFGFGHATIRWLARARGQDSAAEVQRVVGTSFWVFVGTAGVGASLILLGNGFLVERYFQIPEGMLSTARTTLYLGAVFFIWSMFGNLASAAWQGVQRFGTLNLIAGAGATVQVVGSIALVLAGYTVVHVVAWSMVLGLFMLVVHGIGLRRALPEVGFPARPHGETFRAMARFGFLLMLAGLLSQVFLTGGPLVLGHFVLVGALPLFTVPFGIFQRLYRLASGIASALYPLVSELEGKEDTATLDKVFVSGTRTLLLAGFSGGLPAVLLAGPFLTVWMGADFAREATLVLELLFAAFVLTLATVPSVELARGTGRAGRIVGYVGVLAVLNLTGVALLAQRFGVSGAALAFLTAQIVGSTLMIVWTGGRNTSRLLGMRVLGVLVGGIALTLWLHDLAASAPGRLAAALAVGVAVSSVSFHWALSDEERTVLQRLVGRT